MKYIGDTKQKILAFIHDFEKKNDYCPDKSVIAKNIGISKQNIYQHFKDMESILCKYREYKKYFIKK